MCHVPAIATPTLVLFLAAASTLAQPTDVTDLGTLDPLGTPITITNTTPPGTDTTKWFQFTLDQPITDSRYLTIWRDYDNSYGSVVLFSADGAPLFNFGDSNKWGVMYHADTPCAPTLPSDLRFSYDPLTQFFTLPPGTYFIAISEPNVNVAVPFSIEPQFTWPQLGISASAVIEFKDHAQLHPSVMEPFIELGIPGRITTTLTECGGTALQLGATVTAQWFSTPDAPAFVLHDDGVMPDTAASDGIYSSWAIAPGSGVQRLRLTASADRLQARAEVNMNVINGPRPANDACETAQQLLFSGSTPIIVLGTTQNATGQLPATHFETPSRAVFYKFNTGDNAGEWQFNTCRSNPFDSTISIFANCTGAGDSVPVVSEFGGCNYGGSGGNYFDGADVFALLPPNTDYILSVNVSRTNSPAGDFTLAVIPPQSQNPYSNCANALQIEPSPDLIQTHHVSLLGDRHVADPGPLGSEHPPTTWRVLTLPETNGIPGSWVIRCPEWCMVNFFEPSQCNPDSEPFPLPLVAVYHSEPPIDAAQALVSGRQYLVGICSQFRDLDAWFQVEFVPTRGACCLGNQVVPATALECAEAGGVYQGDESLPRLYAPLGVFHGPTMRAKRVRSITSSVFVQQDAPIESMHIELLGTAREVAELRLEHVQSGTAIRLEPQLSDTIRIIASDSGQYRYPNPAPGQLFAGRALFRAMNYWLDEDTGLTAPFLGESMQGEWKLTFSTRESWGMTIDIRDWAVGFNASETPLGCPDVQNCNDLDFNNDGLVDPDDVDAYFRVLGADESVFVWYDSLDFNNDSSIDPEDIDAYFSVLGGGPCIDY